MEKRIVFTRDDGSCGIIVPSDKTTRTIQEIAEKDVPSGFSYRITDVSNIPTDREFRNAWTDINATETVDVNMTKARTIYMDKIRTVRNEKLKELDIETMKGIDVQPQKQVLRDLPSNIDLSIFNTPEDLKNYWPEELK
jgi:hypothetical protein